jgi:hypothetical protein
MGAAGPPSKDVGMDHIKLQSRESNGLRIIRLGSSAARQPTILGIVARAAAEQAASGQPTRATTLPRRVGVFA